MVGIAIHDADRQSKMEQMAAAPSTTVRGPSEVRTATKRRGARGGMLPRPERLALSAEDFAALRDRLLADIERLQTLTSRRLGTQESCAQERALRP